MTDSPVPPGEASDSAEQFEVRLQKRARMLEQGVAPYPVSVGVTTTISDVRAKYPELEPEQATGERVGVAGRIVHMRVTGKLAFVSLQGGSGERLQAMISFGEVGEESYESLKDLVDLGDHLFVEGEVIASKRGELSIMASTWVVASRSPKTNLVYDDDVEGRTILKKLRSVLYKEGTLVGFFGLHKEEGLNDAEESDPGSQQSADSSSSEFDGNEKDRDDQAKIWRLARKDPFGLPVSKEKFREVIREAGYCDQPARIRSLAKVIVEQKRNRLGPNVESSDDVLILGDIEDYALGFMQNNTKLFVFGRVARALSRFEGTPEIAEELNLRGTEIDKHLLRNRDKGS